MKGMKKQFVVKNHYFYEDKFAEIDERQHVQTETADYPAVWKQRLPLTNVV